MNGPVRRRRFVRALSGGCIVGFAGCLGEDGGDDPDNETGADGDHEENGDDNHEGDDNSSHDHDHDSHGHELGAPESEITVEMVSDDGHHFAPHVVHVEPGGTVEWVLESGSHDTTAYHPDTHGEERRIPDDAEPWASDLLTDADDSFERTFDVEGVYDYACTPHEETGMVGTVVVGWPDPDDEPGLEPPADDHPSAAVEQLERFNERAREVLESERDGNDGHDDHDHGGDDHDH